MQEPLVPVFTPTLVAVLLNAERSAGRPLTEQEVLSLRDGSVCMMMRSTLAQEVADRRGYDDLDPERAWEQWQLLREELSAE